MMPEIVPSRGPRIALLAAGGLLSGLTACASAPPVEVVVDPTPQQNPSSAQQVAAPEGAAAQVPEEVTDGPERVTHQPKVIAHEGRDDCCKGKNDCKGLGGCKTDQHDCRGKNDCKGLGGCKMGECEARSAPPPPRRMKPSQVLTSPAGGQMCCKGQNECKGKGNCKTGDNACKGLNDCKGKGGCAGPC